MAVTQTNVAFNTVGNRKEDYILLSFSGGGTVTGLVTTRLHWIEAVSVEDVSGQEAVFDVYPNSDTASATEDDPGHVFFANVSSGELFNIRCIGW